MKVSEAARELGVRPSTVRRWCVRQRLEFVEFALPEPIPMPKGKHPAAQAGKRTFYRRIKRSSLEALKRSFQQPVFLDCNAELDAAALSPSDPGDEVVRHLEAASRLAVVFHRCAESSEQADAIRRKHDGVVSRFITDRVRQAQIALGQFDQDLSKDVLRVSKRHHQSLLRLGIDAQRLQPLLEAIESLRIVIAAFTHPPASECLEKIRLAHDAYDLDRSLSEAYLDQADKLLAKVRVSGADARAVERLKIHIRSGLSRLDENV